MRKYFEQLRSVPVFVISWIWIGSSALSAIDGTASRECKRVKPGHGPRPGYPEIDPRISVVITLICVSEYHTSTMLKNHEYVFQYINIHTSKQKCEESSWVVEGTRRVKVVLSKMSQSFNLKGLSARRVSSASSEQQARQFLAATTTHCYSREFKISVLPHTWTSLNYSACVNAFVMNLCEYVFMQKYCRRRRTLASEYSLRFSSAEASISTGSSMPAISGNQ